MHAEVYFCLYVPVAGLEKLYAVLDNIKYSQRCYEYTYIYLPATSSDKIIGNKLLGCIHNCMLTTLGILLQRIIYKERYNFCSCIYRGWGKGISWSPSNPSLRHWRFSKVCFLEPSGRPHCLVFGYSSQDATHLHHSTPPFSEGFQYSQLKWPELYLSTTV